MARPGPEPGHSGPPFSAASDTHSFRAGFGRSLLCLFKGCWFPCWNIIFQLPFQDYLMCSFQCTFNLSWNTYWKLHFQTTFHIKLIISFQHAFQTCWYISWKCSFRHVFQLLLKWAKNQGDIRTPLILKAFHQRISESMTIIDKANIYMIISWQGII